MSQNAPESEPRDTGLSEGRSGEIFHGSRSGEVIGPEPGDNFIAPNMTLDSYDTGDD